MDKPGQKKEEWMNDEIRLTDKCSPWLIIYDKNHVPGISPSRQVSQKWFLGGPADRGNSYVKNKFIKKKRIFDGVSIFYETVISVLY